MPRLNTGRLYFFFYAKSNNNNDNLIEIVELLVEEGAEINTKSNQGDTPLHVLCFYYKNDSMIEILQVFYENGADERKTIMWWEL